MAVPRSGRHTAMAVLVGAWTLAGGAARAADLLPPPPPPVAVAPVGGGWYLRGDVTASAFERPRDATLPDANDPGMPPLVGLRLGTEPGFGGGVGYRVNEWLRVDATVDDRAPARFRAYSSRSNFATGYNVEAEKVDVLTGLVNVYADLGTWWGLTPYVGGGIGVADKAVHAAYTQTTCTQDACDGQPGTGPRTAVARPNRSVTSFAWALSAGLSYAITPGLSVDAGYRYVDLGRAKSGTDAYGGTSRLKDLAANEFRIGLRYQFAGGLIPGGGLRAAPDDPYGN